VFTGIIEELGRFVGADGIKYRFQASTVLADAKTGDSIAVNGCCLTLVDQGDGWWVADVSDETAKRTNLVDLEPGDRINLERPMKVDDRFGGHIVQGHVDGLGVIVETPPDLRVELPQNLLRYCVEKGSITIDGISLTIVDVLDHAVTAAIIPHTASVTTLGYKNSGSRVNIEVDVMAKYVERLMAPYATTAAK